MTFYIEKLILWLKSGTRRELDFQNDKINIITGNSKTGKTAILEIIDYCFLGGESTISEKRIGNNVAWYGIKFHINENVYTIARGEYVNKDKMSDEYYYSTSGAIPEIPRATIPKDGLKAIIEKEFSIDSRVVIPFGGNEIKQNSRISFRYFWLFNTLSGDIIAHSKDYFDKLHINRYREALHRVFDLALGVTTIKNISLYAHIVKIEDKIKKLENQKAYQEAGNDKKQAELQVLIKKAKDHKIISAQTAPDDSIQLLKDIFESGNLPDITIGDDEALKQLRQKKQVIEMQLRSLKRFNRGIERYKKALSNDQEALKPVNYILKNFSTNINDEYMVFLKNLESALKEIKKEIRDKRPFEFDIDSKKLQLEQELSELEEKIALIPEVDNMIKNDNQRLISIGEIKTEFFNLINQKFDLSEFEENIAEQQKNLSLFKEHYVDPEEKRLSIISALNEYIQIYIDNAKDALDEYGSYQSDFDYKNKALRLRKPKDLVPANITSSSDHLFMHLCLFLGMHHLIMKNEVPYIAPFLIIDQPTRPYFSTSKFNYKDSEENLDKKDDWVKVKEIFNLLNTYMENILADNLHFQIILLEHVDSNAWEGCNHVHLVDIFDGINSALIPPSEINDQDDE